MNLSPSSRAAMRLCAATRLTALSGLLLLGASRETHATVITETTDFGSTRVTAQSLNGLFTADSNLAGDNVYGVGDPTAIINGSIGGANDIDFFSFSGLAGQQFYFDADGSNFDSVLGLFDSSGVLVAQGDQISSPFDPGSTSGNNAFLGVYTLKKNDTFTLSISAYANRPSAFNGTLGTQMVRPLSAGEAGSGVANDDGNRDRSDNTTVNDAFLGNSAATGSYTLNATRVAPVPEPSTYAMMLLGAGALGLMAWKRKRGANPEADLAAAAI